MVKIALTLHCNRYNVVLEMLNFNETYVISVKDTESEM